MQNTSRIGPRDLKNCPLCARGLVSLQIGGRSRLACEACEFVHWDNPRPVTATLVPSSNGLVLVRRKYEPFVNDWCLPGGFMESGEEPEESARREVFEETGLDVDIAGLLGAYSPGNAINVIILFYLARSARGSMTAGDDASEVNAFGVDDLPSNICFPLHRKMIREFFSIDRNGDKA